jgi:hypothetical protein
MKGILIDVEQKELRMVEINDYKEIYNHLKCDLFTMVDADENNSIFVDDEGLLRLTNDSKFFLFDTYPQPLAGNGLILGIDHEDGESIDTSLTIEELKDRVKFLNLSDIRMAFR